MMVKAPDKHLAFFCGEWNLEFGTNHHRRRTSPQINTTISVTNLCEFKISHENRNERQKENSPWLIVIGLSVPQFTRDSGVSVHSLIEDQMRADMPIHLSVPN